MLLYQNPLHLSAAYVLGGARREGSNIISYLGSGFVLRLCGSRYVHAACLMDYVQRHGT